MTKPRKPKPPSRLPDSRLRMERRPAWLSRPVKSTDLRQCGCMALGDAVRLYDALGELIAAKTALDDHPIRTTGAQVRCRVCQCTEGNCIGCINLTGGRCRWSPDDPTVCTACVKPKAGAG
jgi:hypothetical protein